MRKRTGDVMLRKREKFGRKAGAIDCIVVNGDFETGDLTGWTCAKVIGGCGVLYAAGNCYARITLQ